MAYQRHRYDDAEALFAVAQATYDEIGERLGGAHARKSRGDVALGLVKAGAAGAEHLAVARRWFVEAEGLYGEIAWQGRALVGAARCSIGDARTALATRAAACLERSGRLVEARALEGKFGVIVSLSVVRYPENDKDGSAGSGLT